MEHSPVHRTLLQRAWGNVHPRDQVPSRIHDGADGWQGKDSDGKMRIVPITPERVESIRAWQSGMDQHETALWQSIQKPTDLKKRSRCPWYHRNCAIIVGQRGQQHQHHHGRHAQRDGYDADGKQRKCAVNERVYDCH